MDSSQCKPRRSKRAPTASSRVASGVEQCHGVGDDRPSIASHAATGASEPALVRAEQAAPAYFASAQLGHRVRSAGTAGVFAPAPVRAQWAQRSALPRTSDPTSHQSDSRRLSINSIMPGLPHDTLNIEQTVMNFLDGDSAWVTSRNIMTSVSTKAASAAERWPRGAATVGLTDRVRPTRDFRRCPRKQPTDPYYHLPMRTNVHPLLRNSSRDSISHGRRLTPRSKQSSSA